MADDLKPAAVQPSLIPAVSPDGGSLSARSERLLIVAIALLAALSIWLGWRAFYYQEEGDPVGSAMLAFEKQNSLVVFASRFEVVAESEYEQTVAGLPVRRVRQAMIVPASIDYRLDLSDMARDDFGWDEASQTLTVTLPQLQASRPNIDEAKAKLFTEGLLNTGGSQQQLSEANSKVAEQKAAAFARNPEVLSLARTAAREAVRQNLAVPLQTVGYDAARIAVRFADE